MESRVRFLSVLVILGSLASSVVCKAVDTTAIDKVRVKEVLDSTDFQVIDNFMSQSVSELVKTRDFTGISKAVSIILSKKNSDLAGNQGQYAAQFSESANKYIPIALKSCDEMTDAERAFKVRLNLFILADGLEDVKLADSVLGQLNNKNEAIRYWVVRCLSNEGLISKLNSDINANGGFAKRVLKDFEKTYSNSDPLILPMMVRFAAKIDVPEGQDLLVKIADSRMKLYQSGQVSDEVLDGDILKMISYKIQKTEKEEDKALLGREFGQYFSYVIQRYLAGQKLSTEEKQALVTVMAETEKSCIGALLGTEQFKIRRALSQEDNGMLQDEHDQLLGSDGQAGALGLKLGFDYGKGAEGKELPGPAKLPK